MHGPMYAYVHFYVCRRKSTPWGCARTMCPSCTYVCKYEPKYVCMYICTYGPMQACMYVCMYVCMDHTHTIFSICTYTHT